MALRFALFNDDHSLRSGWQIAIFFTLLAAALLPAVLASAAWNRQLSVAEQAVLILAVTWICQKARGKRLEEVTGPLNGRSARELGTGVLLGALLMVVPAAVLWLSGSVDWRVSGSGPSIFAHALLGMAAVAIAEELLFRGFLFQRLIDGLGAWTAQFIIGGLFVLTHLGNPGMDGATRLWAGLNIFIASFLFGFAYLRTRSLALPIGIHFAANVTQGPILGFGVSGNTETGLLHPILHTSKDWLTGGQFGLEASLPGLIAIIAGVALLLWSTRQRLSTPAGPRWA